MFQIFRDRVDDQFWMTYTHRPRDTINQNNSGVVSETETALMGFVAVREEPIIASGYDIATFSQIIEDNKPTPEWFLEYLGMADLADEQES